MKAAAAAHHFLNNDCNESDIMRKCRGVEQSAIKLRSVLVSCDAPFLVEFAFARGQEKKSS